MIANPSSYYPFSSTISEDDVVDGTGAVKQALLSIFYKLEKQQREEGFLSLLKPAKVPYQREKDQPSGVTLDSNADTML